MTEKFIVRSHNTKRQWEFDTPSQVVDFMAKRTVDTFSVFKEVDWREVAKAAVNTNGTND